MKIQNAYGTKNKREKELAKVNMEMSKHFDDTFDTEDVLRNGEPFKLMIVHDTDSNTYKKKIKSRHDDKFNLGDYIEWNGQVWIVTLLDSDEKTWNRGYMYQCTILLRWQNSKGEIVERWGYSEDFTKYSTGTTGNEKYTVGDYQYGLTLPVDEETKIMKRDKRFPIDIEGVEPPDIYKLTNRKVLLTDNRYFDRGGILIWTLSFSEFNSETDKKIKLKNGMEVWICDYKPPRPLPPEPDETLDLSAIIDGNNKLKNGFDRDYSVTFVDSNKNKIQDVDFSWNIISDFEVAQKIDGNIITLLVDDENCIGSSFLLQVIVDGIVLSEIPINVIEAF